MVSSFSSGESPESFAPKNSIFIKGSQLRPTLRNIFRTFRFTYSLMVVDCAEAGTLGSGCGGVTLATIQMCCFQVSDMKNGPFFCGIPKI